MQWFAVPWRHVPEDEYIASLRRSIAVADKLRFWLVLLYIVQFFIVAWAFGESISLLWGFVQPANVPMWLSGFVVGVMLGITAGLTLYGIAHGIASAMGGLRAERLVLKLIDDQSGRMDARERVDSGLSRAEEAGENAEPAK